ncbi:MAG: hypothetical protein R2699_14830 [Acidimicrobiales bacterium]
MPRRVAIVGAALSDTGRVDDKTNYHLHAQAVQRAVADAGLTKHDVDGFCSNGLGTLQPIDVAEYLGLRPHWVDSTQVGGGTWEVMACHAADAIAMATPTSSRARLRIDHPPTLARLPPLNLSYGNRGPVQYEVAYGHTIAKYAMSTRRHMYEYGTTLEQLAEDRRRRPLQRPVQPGRLLPGAAERRRGPQRPDQGRPVHQHQCCIRSDGGCAIVLAAEDRIADCATEPVWVLGHGHAVSHVTMSEWDDFTTGPAAVAGQQAFARAGVSPDEMDLACIYDAFTFMEMATLEDLGFCEKGEGGPFVEDGKLRLGGALPTNPDGGGLSACHPGMRGLFLLVEATRQLRGDYAGGTAIAENGEPIPAERQVPNAKLAVASGTGGWFCSNGTLVLGVD